MWTSVSSSGISFAQHGRRRVVRSVASALSLPAGVPCNVAVNRVSGARLLSSSSCQTCYESSRLSSREIDITGTGTATNSRRSQSTAALTPTPTTSDADAAGALSLPEPDANLIDFQIAAKIVGDESHVAMVELRPGETLRAESGAMIFMTEGIVMDTKLNGASSAFSRMLTGQNMFLTDFRYENPTGTGTVCLGTDFPSKILRLSLADHPEQTLICQKGAYLASNPNVSIEVQFTKSFTSGFFGGQGFVLQKLRGHGDVLVRGGGTMVKKQLRHGETLRVTSGSLVALESTIAYDVQMMPGISNAMFGGEGLFVTTLTGPGTVWLQGLPPDRMIAEIARRVPSRGSGIGLGIPLGIGGGGGGEGSGGVGDVPGAGDVGAATATTAAASEAAVEADRAATVATSGMASETTTSGIDADSPSALFGDAAAATSSSVPPSSTSSNSPIESSQSDTNSSWDSTAASDEPTYGDDDTSFSSQNSSSSSNNEPSFDDEFSADGDDMVSSNDGELFDDTVASSAEQVSEEAKSMFRQLWDFFSDQDS